MSAALDQQLAALAASVAGGIPVTSLTIDEARGRVDAGGAGAEPGPELHSVEDGTVPDGARGVPVRTYRPRATTTRTLVYAHGGGWVTGNLDYSDALCRHIARVADCTVISVDYRLAPEHPHPAAADDVFTVVASALSSASGEPVAVGGDSAGGHLAALAALRAARSDLPLAFQALVYPVIDNDFSTRSYDTMKDAFPLTADAMRWFWEQYAPGAPTGDPMLAPAHADLTGVAPAYLATAGHDPLHDEASRYADQLRAAGVAVTHDDFESLCHGFLRFTLRVAEARGAQARISAAIDSMFAAAEEDLPPR